MVYIDPQWRAQGGAGQSPPLVAQLLKNHAKVPSQEPKRVLKEKRLSDLMLLSIEGDISIDQNKVIDIYKQMAKRRILL